MSERKWSRAKKITVLGLILAAVVGLLYYLTKGNGSAVTYEPFQVKKESIQVSILSTGTVQPENRVDIKPPIKGRAEEVIANEGEAVRKGQVLAWMSSTERAAMIDAARSQGPEELKKWEDLYRPTPVIAPVDGTIIQRNIESGQTFADTDPIFVMSDRLIVEALVDETDIAQIKLDSEAEIILDSYPKVSIPAKVRQIAFEARTINNVTAYIVVVLPDEVPDFMRSGMTANVTFYIASQQDVLVVPNTAIQMSQGKRVVLLPGDPKPVEKEVDFGATDGKNTEILSGLREGDTVWIEHVKKSESRGSSSPFGGMGRRRGR